MAVPFAARAKGLLKSAIKMVSLKIRDQAGARWLASSTYGLWAFSKKELDGDHCDYLPEFASHLCDISLDLDIDYIFRH